MERLTAILFAAWMVVGALACARWMWVRPRGMRRRVVTGVLPVVVAGLVVLGAAVVPDRSSLQWDVTTTRRNTVSPSTRRLLRSIRGPVRITAFFNPNDSGWTDAASLVKAYEREGRREGVPIRVRFVDPARQPGLARSYGIQTYGELVIERKGKAEHAYFPSEIEISGTLLRTTYAPGTVACLVAGHGGPGYDDVGPSSASKLLALLRTNGVRVRPVTLTSDSLDGCSMALLLNPTTPPLPREKTEWARYVSDRGKALVLVDERSANQWLEPLGASVLGPVDDPGAAVVDDPTAVVVSGFPSASPATSGVPPLYFTNPVAFRVDDPGGSGGASVSPLLATTPAARLRSGQGSAPFILGFARDVSRVERTGATSTIVRSRVAVIGDTDWATDGFIDLLGNRALASQLVAWLLARENLLDVPDRPLARPIVISRREARSVFVASVVGPAVLLATAGLAVHIRRRRLK